MRSICIRSYRPEFSGYGYGVKEFVEGFRRNGYDVELQDGLNAPKKTKKDVIIHFGFPHLFKTERGKVNIGRVMLESDSAPRLWVECMNRLDEVWVASRFNKKTFEKAGVKKEKLVVVPDMVNPRLYKFPTSEGRKRGRFRFLSVFLDLSLRKGWDILLEEFVFTFRGDKRVEWVVQCSGEAARGLRKRLAKLKKNGYPVDNIKIRGRRPSIDGLRRLYYSADCYVLPTRGEGFGKPFLEAAACGLPVIATGWGGQMEFLNKNNCRLLKYKLKKVPAPEALDCYFLTGQKWAEPDRNDLARALQAAAYRMLDYEPVEIARFTEEAVIKKASARVEKLKPGKPPTRELKPQIIVFDDEWNERTLTPGELKKRIRRMGDTVAVAGTGLNAGWLYDFLLEQGFRVPYFIDRKEGRFKKKKVYPVKELPEKLRVDAVLISAFPASFAEWRHLLRGKKNLPVIYYRPRH